MIPKRTFPNYSPMGPRIPSTGSNIMQYPECLTVVRGSFVPSGAPARSYVKETDKPHPQKAGDMGLREDEDHVTLPGFVHPVPMRSEGLLAQKIKQQLEEHKKRKEKPSLHNPETRE